MNSIAAQILKHGRGLPEGTVLSAKAFLHVGTRAAVDQALSRLTRSGHLLRVGRGRYVRPVETRFGTRAPTPEKVVEGFSELSGEIVVSSGAVAANALGLTTQVPVRSVFLTSGRTRRFQLGQQVVELKHAPAWQLRAPHRPAGQAMRALAWLGPTQARKSAKMLKRTLPRSEQKELAAARASLPTWLAQVVSETFVVEEAKRARVRRG